MCFGLDKTGTITEGNMKVETVYPLRREDDIPWFDGMLWGLSCIIPMITMLHFKAIKGYYQECKRYAPVTKNSVFLSKKKWSANDIGAIWYTRFGST